MICLVGSSPVMMRLFNRLMRVYFANLAAERTGQ
jgi:hypothetical protein